MVICHGISFQSKRKENLALLIQDDPHPTAETKTLQFLHGTLLVPTMSPDYPKSKEKGDHNLGAQ
jgi:hypothetical protein